MRVFTDANMILRTKITPNKEGLVTIQVHWRVEVVRIALSSLFRPQFCYN